MKKYKVTGFYPTKRMRALGITSVIFYAKSTEATWLGVVTARIPYRIGRWLTAR